MRFVSFDQVAEIFRGKSVALVGSAPSVLDNEPGFIDSHDLVVRVNNYKLSDAAGKRTDVHYSFYGSSIRKTAHDLSSDGVKLCMCKCPDSQPLDSDWHHRNGKMNGVDFRYIYRTRKMFWFCDTYVPGDASFLQKFNLLQRHIPTTGFAALLDLLECPLDGLYLTGFDFFTSGVHNVDERWAEKNTDDPICHRPDLEAEWLASNAHAYPIAFDEKLREVVRAKRAARSAA